MQLFQDFYIYACFSVKIIGEGEFHYFQLKTHYDGGPKKLKSQWGWISF